MRYRILAPGYLNNPFRLVSTLYIDDKTGEHRDIPFQGDSEVFSLQVEVGTVVELDDRTMPAPWLEPMDEEAREMCAKYPDAYAPSMTLSPEESIAPIGPVIPDRQSYRNETAGPSKAPVYAKPVQARLADRPAPKLPSLGSAARPGVR